MRVWIDQDLCTGDGLCSDHAPDVFTLLEDGIAYVVEFGVPQNDPGGPGSVVEVPPRLDDAVVRAAEVCPGECIFLEIVLDENDLGGPTPTARPAGTEFIERVG